MGYRHYPVQLLAGINMSENTVVEVKTGEGKTIIAVLPAVLNALLGNKVYIVTSNSYLARRDKDQLEDIYKRLGLSVGLIYSGQTLREKIENYSRDIVYGTGTEFGFDYLRDCITINRNRIRQGAKDAIIIDEADAVLLDRGKQPLILSSDRDLDIRSLKLIDQAVKSLEDGLDFEIDSYQSTVLLTEKGSLKLEEKLGLDNMYHSDNLDVLHYIRQSLVANFILEKDKDYVLKNGKLVLVSKMSGRLSNGVRLGGGLHQALEVKESLKVNCDSKTLSKINYYNYISLFKKVSGMTGTACSAEKEFMSIYGLKVVDIPTNRPSIRLDRPDRVFINKEVKNRAIIKDIFDRHLLGQPILVVSNYVYETESLSAKLTDIGLKHRVLNAKQTEDEAEIISKAGKKGSITISTNMAGRGTDIKLSDESRQCGGLYVLGTSRAKFRRIDDQLIGRAGRQGDPGESQFYISLEDELFKGVYRDFEDNIYEKLSKYEIVDGEYKVTKAISNIIDFSQKEHEMKASKKFKMGMKKQSILEIQRETYLENRDAILYADSLEEILEANTRVLQKLKELGFNYNLSISVDDIVIYDFELFREKILLHFNESWSQYIDDISELYRRIDFYNMGKKGKFSLDNSYTVFEEESFKIFNDMLFMINKFPFDVLKVELII